MTKQHRLRAATKSALAVLTYGALASCNEGDALSPPLYRPVRVEIEPNQLSLEEGELAQVRAWAADASGTAVPCTLIWSSWDPAIVRLMDQDGSIRAERAGAATISASCGHLVGSAQVTVSPASITGVTVVPQVFALKQDEAITLVAVARSAFILGLPQKVATWSSSDPAVVSVDQAGRVTAHSRGSAQITATIEGVAGSAVAHAFLGIDPSVTQVDIGTPGSTSVAHAINAQGAVVGYNTTIFGATHAFLWTPEGGMLDLGTLGGNWSIAYGINDAGEVVGESATTNGIIRAFRWTASEGMRQLEPNDASGARAINARGEIVGWLTTASGRGFHRTPDGIVTVIAGAMFPTAINSSGVTVGHQLPTSYDCYYYGVCESAAYRWSAVGGLSAILEEASTANDINDHGQVVGELKTGTPYRWNATGGPQELVAFDVPTRGKAVAINEFSEVAGSAEIQISYALFWTATGEAVILCDVPSGAHGVNDSGWVVGWRQEDGVLRATLWRVSGLARP